MKSIRTKMLCLLLGTVLIASILIGGIGVYTTGKVVRADSEQMMNTLCTEKVQGINMLLWDIEQSVNTVYHYADAQLTDVEKLWKDKDERNDYIEKVGAVLQNAAENTSCAIAVYFRLNPEYTAPTEGMFLAREEDDGPFLDQPMTDLSKYPPDDFEHVGWYYVPMERGTATWLEPYENYILGIKMISYIIPFYKDGVAIGIIGMDIDMKLLQENVSDISIYDTGYAFLTDAKGDIVYHKDYPEGTSKEELKEELKNERIAVGRLDNGMMLEIAVPVEEIDKAQNRQIIQYIVLLIVILAVTLFISLYMAESITKPLRELSLIAYTDVLTGLETKQAYNKAVICLNRSIQEKKASFGIIIMDINNLYQINDICGSGKCDAILIDLSAIMRQVYGTYPIYRICDNEFVVILQDTDSETCQKLLAQFQTEVDTFNRERNTCPEELCIATGQASYDAEKDKNFEDVYVRADKVMYQDKVALNARNSMKEDALKMLCMVFHKILKINLTQDNFYEIKVYDEECSKKTGYSKRASEWLRGFAETGQIYSDDLSEYYAFTNVETIKDKLKEGKTYMNFRYRRKVGNEFRWVQMEIVPSMEYADDNQVIMFYVRDIHDAYTAELEYNKELEWLTNRDSLTGLYNRRYMTKYCRDYALQKHKDVGVVFCDLNGLKYANDHYGHAAGDEVILKFSQLLKKCFPEDMCCRMSGDEFCVCVVQKNREIFYKMVDVLIQENRQSPVPLASIGCYWEAQASCIGPMITKAEDEMYQDKAHFYEEFPMYKR